jgi:hypothetical protein
MVTRVDSGVMGVGDTRKLFLLPVAGVAVCGRRHTQKGGFSRG